MMFPKDGKNVCRSCGFTEDLQGSSQVVVTNSKDKEMTIISSEDNTLPKTNILCPKCGHTEAFFIIRQTRAADEPETRFYRCCKCDNTWREY